MQVKCALVQMGFSTDTEENVARAAEFVREAGRAGAKIISLPELAQNIYFCYELNRERFALAETIPGPSTKVISEAARDADAYVVFPMYERGDDGQLYNTAAFIDRSGEIVGTYRKNIIPLMEFEGVTGMEKFYFLSLIHI